MLEEFVHKHGKGCDSTIAGVSCGCGQSEAEEEFYIMVTMLKNAIIRIAELEENNAKMKCKIDEFIYNESCGEDNGRT
jgi:hypothetical protein